MIGDLDEPENGAVRLSFLPEDPILVEQGLRNFQRAVDRCRGWDARRRTD